MIRFLLRLCLAVLLMAGLAVGVFYWWASGRIAAPGPAREPVIVQIPRGTSIGGMGQMLEARGVIDSALLFELAAQMAGAKPLRAGEFQFPARASIAAAVDVLQNGKPVQHKITVAEGLTVAEVLALVRALDLLDGEITLKPEEGTLLPQTYFYIWGDSRDALLQRMRQAMTETLNELWAKRQAGLPLNVPREALILASIVEKETGIAAERARVAGVFVNRLRANMKLETDPTVIYGLTRGQKPLGRELQRPDLQVETPYNTYRIVGLPPGPIANPGRAAIEAALNPAATNELFFVADGSGGHAFAETIDQHNKNVEKWRQIRKDRRQP